MPINDFELDSFTAEFHKVDSSILKIGPFHFSFDMNFVKNNMHWLQKSLTAFDSDRVYYRTIYRMPVNTVPNMNT